MQQWEGFILRWAIFAIAVFVISILIFGETQSGWCAREVQLYNQLTDEATRAALFQQMEIEGCLIAPETK